MSDHGDPNQPNPSVGDPNTGRPPIDPTGAATPPGPPAGYMPMAYAPPAQESGKKGGVGQRLATTMVSSVLLLSIFLNIYFFVLFYAQFSGGIGERTYEEGDARYRIAVVKVDGVIGENTYAYLREAFNGLKKNPPSAVVLRVSSPGGGLTASDQIHRAITEFKTETKVPVVASFGLVAASGGYYISSPADHIVSEPTTITGSIGVIAQAFTFGKLLDKIGVTPETVIATGSGSKSVLDATRPWNDNDRAVLRKFLDTGWERFVTVVKNGRGDKMTEAEVKAAASGLPFTTKEALDMGLVDSEGYLDDAITEAGKLAKLPKGVKPTITVITKPVGLLSTLMAEGPGAEQQAIQNMSPSDAKSWIESLDPQVLRRWMQDLSTPRMEARWSPTLGQ